MEELKGLLSICLSSEYLPIGFQTKLIAAEFFQRWAKSNSDYNKSKLFSDLWAVS